MGYTKQVKAAVIPLAFAMMGCGGSGKLASPKLTAMCNPDSHYDGRSCVAVSSAGKLVAQAHAALADFDVDKAMPLLDQALAQGPHDNEVLINLHKERGIAFSYMREEENALASFHMLLTLDPGHLLNYTLSPQTTFLFERARRKKSKEKQSSLHISWPQDRYEDDDIPITVEVLSDPTTMLDKMALFVRYNTDAPYQRVSLDLNSVGKLTNIQLPAANTKRATTLQLYGSAYNKKGDEVMLWFSPEEPREIPLAYQAPSPWFRKWWVWAIAGGTVATVTGVTVYALSLEPADTLGGAFSY